MKITLVLHNIRSVYNVGAILRTAEGLGVEKVIYSGYTPSYDDQTLLPHLRDRLNHQIEKAALGAEKIVAQEKVSDLPAWLATQRAAGSSLVGLENNLSPEEEQRKVMLDQLADACFWGSAARETHKDRSGRRDPRSIVSKPHEHNLVLLLGEEVHGIPPAIRQECDYFLEIPMVGRKESFNVSVATAIALWGLMH